MAEVCLTGTVVVVALVDFVEAVAVALLEIPAVAHPETGIENPAEIPVALPEIETLAVALPEMEIPVERHLEIETLEEILKIESSFFS